MPRRPGCPPGLRPLGWRRERSGGFLNGESENGGRLELWLSLETAFLDSLYLTNAFKNIELVFIKSSVARGF